ncbi:MAG: shikimate kinase [Candidatus Cloacimonetes bacterium]|nr:shikimate kinase [Candidatus Cloacimonadota bacterium]
MDIYIIGFTRAGKSSLAKSLANSWQIPAYDTDELIELECAHSIAEIVADHGWDAFRKLESSMLLKLGNPSFPASPFNLSDIPKPSPEPGARRISRIISCGGGIVENPINRDFLKQQRVFWLNPPWALILSRLQTNPSAICWGRTAKQLFDLYQIRYPLYREIVTQCKN